MLEGSYQRNLEKKSKEKKKKKKPNQPPFSIIVFTDYKFSIEGARSAREDEAQFCITEGSYNARLTLMARVLAFDAL